MEGECEHELVIVAQLENKIRRAGYGFGILQSRNETSVPEEISGR